jgi:APA family basic amino acid/polyamine antiporter
MTTAPLARRLGLADAVTIGLGAMIGAGVFAVFAPAAAAAGPWLLAGLAIAAVVAFCNATSSAQLAAQYPTSGGSYVYGRERLGEWPGFLAGWSFIIGKTASCAAMALTVAAYVAPAGWERPVAVVVVAGLASVNYIGVTRTAFLTKVIVAAVLLVLVFVIVSAALHPGIRMPWAGLGDDGDVGHDVGWYDVMQSAGLLFFAFAGYARIATMGEEVRDPARTIPRAIMIALSVALLVYALVAVTVLGVLGPEKLAASTRPLGDVAAATGLSWATPIVSLGAALAALGALLALIAGVARTTLAMARTGDLPRWLAGVHPRFAVPHHAEIAIALIVTVLVVTVDLRGAIGFSSFGVLVYYLVANLAAFTQSAPYRRFPKALQLAGATVCVALVATLPPVSILGGLSVLAAGAAYRALWARRNAKTLG